MCLPSKFYEGQRTPDQAFPWPFCILSLCCRCALVLCQGLGARTGIPNPSAQEVTRGAGSTESSGLEWFMGRLGHPNFAQFLPEFLQQRYFCVLQNPGSLLQMTQVFGSGVGFDLPGRTMAPVSLCSPALSSTKAST